MQITTQINLKALEAISLFAAKEETRYALNGVLVEVMPHETRFVATDGHSLAIYRMPQDNGVDRCYTSIIPANAVKQVKGLFGKTTNPININIDISDSNHRPELITFSCYDIDVLSTNPIDGRYPDYLMVMPKVISGELGIYPPEGLITFDKAAKILSKHYRSDTFYTTCRLHHNGPTGPGVITLMKDSNFTGLVMAIKADTDGSGLDTWWLTGDKEVAND